MKKIFIVGNWKSNKTISETEEWFHSFNDGLKIKKPDLTNKKVIIAPSFTALEHARYCSGNLKLPIRLAAQNVSPFGEGQYTGEVSARQIKELVDYVIIGHSERRQNLHENEDMILKKLEMAQKYELTPIFCTSEIEQVQSAKFKAQNNNSNLKNLGKTMIVAYEPVFAIGTGNPDTPENAEAVAKKIKEILDIPVIYGGSVTAQNVKSFTQMPNISGVLPGGASLDPVSFLSIVINA